MPVDDEPVRSRVVVFGSINSDVTVMVDTVPADGETVLASAGRRGLGGKGANQAVAAARAGAPVAFVGAVGDDPEGRELVRRLGDAGVETAGIRLKDDQTGLAVVIVSADGENRIAVVPGANGLLDAADGAVVGDLLRDVDALVVQGELPVAATAAAIAAGVARGSRVIVNLAPVADVGPLLALADPLVVNEGELAAVAQIEVSSVADLRRHVGALSGIARSLVVTLGGEGAVVIRDGALTHIPAVAAPVVRDTTGAGDALVGVLAARLAGGDTLVDATRQAVRCASATVTAVGAAESYPDFLALLRESQVCAS
ncbi:MAG: ribokinase [Actinobacteria bacterium]|nr:ribokinase [Actinomycetota bacterium]MCG2797035.1 ribokinase [Cellulomonas sp.]